ncbi:MAG: hypothetical protein PHU63_02255 [Candidatus ainarchaeum sp.]|nr:hypothetical protein [Candidatus ainarchaeum sp.]
MLLGKLDFSVNFLETATSEQLKQLKKSVIEGNLSGSQLDKLKINLYRALSNLNTSTTPDIERIAILGDLLRSLESRKSSYTEPTNPKLLVVPITLLHKPDQKPSHTLDVVLPEITLIELDQYILFTIPLSLLPTVPGSPYLLLESFGATTEPGKISFSSPNIGVGFTIPVSIGDLDLKYSHGSERNVGLSYSFLIDKSVYLGIDTVFYTPKNLEITLTATGSF